jgi:hypothetical protein
VIWSFFISGPQGKQIAPKREIKRSFTVHQTHTLFRLLRERKVCRRGNARQSYSLPDGGDGIAWECDLALLFLLQQLWDSHETCGTSTIDRSAAVVQLLSMLIMVVPQVGSCSPCWLVQWLITGMGTSRRQGALWLGNFPAEATGGSGISSATTIDWSADHEVALGEAVPITALGDKRRCPTVQETGWLQVVDVRATAAGVWWLQGGYGNVRRFIAIS